jgi:hypothetical protein
MNTRQTNTQKRDSVRTVKVVAVEADGCEDVYNMEVDGTHCFAVNGGLIVHNCMDEIRYFCNTVLRRKVGREPWVNIF